MATDQFQVGEIAAENLGSASRAILMIDSVKTKFANSLLHPFVGAGINGGGIRQTAVKAGIEYRELRHRAATFFKKGFDERDTVEFQTIVQRREGGHFFYRGLYVGSDHHWTIVGAATIHDAVTDDVNFG